MVEKAMLAAGLQVFRGISDSATNAQNAKTYDAQARSVQQTNELNERMEAESAAEALSERRTFEAASGLTDSQGTVSREILKKYLRDKTVRKFNADTEAASLRSQANEARLRSGTSLLGGLGGAWLSYEILKVPGEKTV